MGFLKFLKKKKEGGEVSGLDLPPAPPAFEDISEDHLDSDIPSFEDDGDFFTDSLPKSTQFPNPTPVPKPIQVSKPTPVPKSSPSSKVSAEEYRGYEPDTNFDLETLPELPSPPSFPEISEDNFPETAVEKSKTTPLQRYTIQKATESLPVYNPPKPTYTPTKPTAFSQPSFQASSTSHIPVSRGRSIYIPMEQFKDVLRGINSIRSSINGIEHTFRKIEELENAKEKSFNSLSLSMHDLQKRLIYVDKKLASGGD